MLRIEVSLFQVHGVVVTIEEFVAFWLPTACETVRILHRGLALGTTLGLDFNHTVSTLRTPNGCCCSVLEDGDRLDILGVDIEEFGKLLFVGIGVVEVGVSVVGPNVTVDHDERVGVTVDGGNTTETHGGTGTEVTRVGNDVETCDTTLEGFVNRSHTDTFELLHIDGLAGYRNFSDRNLQTRSLCLTNRLDGYFLELRVALQDNLAECSLGDGQVDCLATDVGDSDFVLRIHNLE